MPDRIRSKSLRNLLGYWEAKENYLGRLPARADLQPDEMVPFLPFVALINVQVGQPRFQFRLVGTGIVGSMGRETTNRPVDENLFGANAVAFSASRWIHVAPPMRPANTPWHPAAACWPSKRCCCRCRATVRQ